MDILFNYVLIPVCTVLAIEGFILVQIALYRLLTGKDGE